ncbi:MAG: O-antigen ligase family protein, partial [Betaproteobacteria bacterium]
MTTIRPAFTGAWPAMLPMALLVAMLFLLSADLLFVPVAGGKVKYGYFVILATWATAPAAMFAAARDLRRRIPAYAWLPLVPLAISVATSVNLRDSILWTLWLAFDLFTIVTVYAFLVAHALTGNQVRTAATGALALIAAFGLYQFVSIYAFHQVVLGPQSHFGVYRINGISGWPHFLNIFAFLLIPIVVVQARLSWITKVVLALLIVALVQSTAKTGWVLFVALGCLLLVFDFPVFRRTYLLFMLPVTVVSLLVPVPSLTPAAPALSGSEKVSMFAADLDIGANRTSGTDRVLISRMGIDVWLRHPWFGVGPRAYDDYVFTRFDQELPGVNKYDANGAINAKNENIWIEFLAECGVLFTVGFALLLGRALWVRRLAF